MSEHQAGGQFTSADEATRERQRQLQFIADHAPVLLAHVSADGRYKFVNRPYAERFGLHPRDIIGRTVPEVLGAEAYARIAPHVAAALSGQRIEYEADVPYAGIGTQTMRVAYEPERDAEGRVVGYVAAVLNISDRKRAEEQLAASRRRLQALFDNTLDAILVADDQAQYVDANPAACQLLGYERDELLRRGVFDVTALPHEEAGRAAWAAFVRDGSQAGEYTLSRKDQSTAVVEYRAVANVQPGVHLSVLRDVTERRRTEEALLASERRFKTLARSAPVGIFETDAEGKCLFVNDRWCAMAALTPEEARGDGWLAALHPDDRDLIQREWRAAAAEGREFSAEYRMRSPQGRVTWLSGSAVALRDPEGTITGYIGTVTDISGLKHAEEQLRRRAEEVEALMDVIPVAVWLSRDRDCRNIVGNRAGLAMLRMAHGANLSKSAPAGEQPTHFRICRGGRELPPEQLPLQYAAAHGVELRGFEEDIVFEDGTVAQLYGSASPLFDEAGAVRGAVAGFIDVTDLKRAGEALRRSEERLRTLSDNLPLGAVYQILGDDQRRRQFLYVSAGIERLFGVPAIEAMADATLLYDLIHEEDRPRVAAADALALRDRAPFECEFRSRTRAGGLIWVHARSAPRMLPTGQVVWEGIVMDVTARKNAEEERTNLAFLVENSTDFIGMCDAAYRPFFVNRAGLAMVGFDSLEQARQTPLLDFFFPEDQAFVANEFLPKVLREGHGEVEIRFRHFRSGEAIWVVYAVVTLRDANGKISGLATISSNVTEQKRVELALRASQEQLVAALADQLRHEQALKEADRRKDDFLATLAHELRNPLAPLRNGLEVMKLAGDNAVAVEQARAMMERQLGQLVHLIDDLLDVSRITRGKLQLRPERVDLAGVVHSAVENSRPLIQARAHQLTVALPAQPVYLDADPLRLAQVFANLLTNAAKYTDRGGTIALSAEHRGSDVVVAVRDNGIGIGAEHLPRLFEMFSQVDSAMERSQGGLGIGLSLVKGLVTMHGGHVEARSEGLGKGSEFLVRLPMAGDPAAATAVGEGVVTSVAGPRRRILVADDNRDAADSLAMMLRLAGHEVHTVHDGQNAVEAAHWFRPDVVLLDIGMPKINGLQAARRIREQPWGQQLLLVAITGWGQEEDKRRATEAGFDRHLTKPVDPVALDACLSAINRP